MLRSRKKADGNHPPPAPRQEEPAGTGWSPPAKPCEFLEVDLEGELNATRAGCAGQSAKTEPATVHRGSVRWIDHRGNPGWQIGESEVRRTPVIGGEVPPGVVVMVERVERLQTKLEVALAVLRER